MSVKYGIFKTKWGYFGIAGTQAGICRTCLPVSSSKSAKDLLCAGLQAPQEDESAFSVLKTRIEGYFEGRNDDFGPVSFDLSGFSEFTQAVLEECANIPTGSVITYSDLAQKLKKPLAMRAVGTALAKNPIPLLIPCHRVVRCDGTMGGFSAVGGIATKERLLQMEQQMVCETCHKR